VVILDIISQIIEQDEEEEQNAGKTKDDTKLDGIKMVTTKHLHQKRKVKKMFNHL
jgi:hypothetical protein